MDDPLQPTDNHKYCSQMKVNSLGLNSFMINHGNRNTRLLNSTLDRKSTEMSGSKNSHTQSLLKEWDHLEVKDAKFSMKKDIVTVTLSFRPNIDLE